MSEDTGLRTADYYENSSDREENSMEGTERKIRNLKFYIVISTAVFILITALFTVTTVFYMFAVGKYITRDRSGSAARTPDGKIQYNISRPLFLRIQKRGHRQQWPASSGSVLILTHPLSPAAAACRHRLSGTAVSVNKKISQ